MKPNYNQHYSSPKQIIDILQVERGLIFMDEAKAERYLFNKFPQIDLAAMGFPADWKDEPLWH